MQAHFIIFLLHNVASILSHLIIQNGSWSPSHHIHILVSMTKDGEMVEGQKGTPFCGISLLYTAFLKILPTILLELKNTVPPNYKEGWKM